MEKAENIRCMLQDDHENEHHHDDDGDDEEDDERKCIQAESKKKMKIFQ